MADGRAAGASASGIGRRPRTSHSTVIVARSACEFVNPPVTSTVSMQPPRPPPCPNRRTSRLPRGARRLQLLRAAQDVFVAQGFHAAAMDDIADRAGVSKPVLYQHFPGKRELYLALLEEHVSELADRVAEAMGGTDDNRERVDAAVGAYFDFIDAEGEAFRLVFESDLRNDADVRGIVDRGTSVCVEAIAEVIAADTGADPERALLLASGLTGLAETSARWWLPRKGTVSRDEAVALMSALAWRGISGFPAIDGDGPTPPRRTDRARSLTAHPRAGGRGPRAGLALGTVARTEEASPTWKSRSVSSTPPGSWSSTAPRPPTRSQRTWPQPCPARPRTAC